MFTGITRGTYEVVATQTSGTVLTYTVALPDTLCTGLQLGASVAIDGVCQTVVRIDGCQVTFDAIQETLACTTLDSLRVGSKVSVERSMRAGDEIGGHEVSGHVVGTGQIAERVHHEGVCDICVAVPQDWMRYLLPKGFVAVDGSSLTIGQTEPSGRFWIHLIPETLRLTNLGHKAVGEQVNIELDSRTVAIVDTVERVLAQRAAPHTE